MWTACLRLLRSVASSRIWTRDLLIASPNALPVAPPRHPHLWYYSLIYHIHTYSNKLYKLTSQLIAWSSDVNKDFSLKDQDQDKDLQCKDQDKDQDFSRKDQDQDKDLTIKDQYKDQDFAVKDKDKDQDFGLKEQTRT